MKNNHDGCNRPFFITSSKKGRGGGGGGGGGCTLVRCWQRSNKKELSDSFQLIVSTLES